MTTATKERPILFSAAMVRAILDGRKHQTRRVIKPQPDESCWFPGDARMAWSNGVQVELVNGRRLVVKRCPYGVVGDRLWVRESFLPCVTARDMFQALWDRINGKTYPWDSNPWTWVISFKKV
jgi:hypothetical protein